VNPLLAEVEAMRSKARLALRECGEKADDADPVGTLCLSATCRHTDAERLREALQPFVEHYERVKHWNADKVVRYYSTGGPAEGRVVYWFTVSELRAAAEAAKEGEHETV
jgi:hypothetical protein